jgi:uncharacterized protein YggU (UPF0235/DUF167 family)
MSTKIISVRVVTNAKDEKVEETAPDTYKVRVGVPPEKGRANDRVVELLAEYFNVPRSHIFLSAGALSRDKIFTIEH